MIMVLPFLLTSAVYSQDAVPSSSAGVENEAKVKKASPTAAERKVRALEVEEALKFERANRGKTIKKTRETIMADKLKEMPVIKMVLVKGGCFQMGDSTGDGDDDERPVHEVCLSDYSISETEVTQELWEIIMDTNPLPRYARSPKKPVTNISWIWANRFIQELNTLTDRFYRLPTEAEWEYAARERGRDIVWSGTNDESLIGRYAWFVDNSAGKFHDVKSKRANGLGLYDMSGNASEWVDDNFGFEYYQTSPVKDPYGKEMSLLRSIRGGSILNDVYNLRTTFRYAGEPVLPNTMVGFRLAE
jgi:formylglycine-generating enzyme required for sulfatase activity